MSNQKATLHSIPLKTMDLCLNKYNADIKPYEGFRENNSPFYGNTLSPFYYRKSQVIDGESFVYTDGSIYKIKNGDLYLEDINGVETKLINNGSSNYIVCDKIYTIGNSIYTNILAWISTDNVPEVLASSIEGRVAILNIDGTVKIAFNTTVEYLPGSLVNFAVKNQAGYYCFSFNGQLYCARPNGSIFYTDEDVGDDVIKRQCIVDNTNNAFIVSMSSVGSHRNTIWCIPCNDDTGEKIYNASIGGVRVTSEGQSITVPKTSFWDLAFNNNGDVLFLDKQFAISSGSGTKIAITGKYSTIVKEDNKYIVVFEAELCETVSDINQETFTVHSTLVDNYICNAVISRKTGGYTTVIPSTLRSSIIPTTQTVYTTSRRPNGYGGFVDVQTPTVVVAGYRTSTYQARMQTYNIATYSINLIDSFSNREYFYPLIDINGEYNGGQIARIGNNFRALYHNGQLTAVSTYPSSSDTMVGTLLCAVSNIDSDAPICNGVCNNEPYIIFKTGDHWEKVTLTKDKSKSHITVANNKYLILNTDAYYNCYDIESHKPRHFASDWNDRAIFCSNNFLNPKKSSNTTFSDYINSCTQYVFASAQAANYSVLDTSFISSIFPRNAGYGYEPTTYIYNLAADTPDDADIDLYVSSLSLANEPYYLESASKTNLLVGRSGEGFYQNIKLENVQYPNIGNELVMAPSIFAGFINGFINSGIIIDNERSYTQVFANNVKPIFAINIASQLEGITDAFIIQGQYFVIINNSIYRYDISSGATTAIINIGEMSLVGYTPYQALLYSPTNKTFYIFTGDNTLNLLVQADEISGIISSCYNPNTMSIYVVTNENIYVFGNEHLIKLRYEGYKKAYPLDSGMAIVGPDTMYLSYNKIEGYTPLNIELETEFYGLGNNYKAVNDTVYMRFFNKDADTGTVKVTCQTLNEGSRKSVSKTFKVTKDMWDKETGTLFLRYQPQFQAAAGFSVKIESPFAIASLDISETHETVQNSKYNI